MSMYNLRVNFPVATNCCRGVRALGVFFLVVGACLMFISAPAHGQAAASLAQTDVKLVIGGDTVKNHSVGTLSLVGNSLQFVSGKKKMEVEASAITDISTNEDSRQNITGAAHFATMAIPYGGGRVLALFSHKVDVLTTEFKDANGGFHGAVFVLPQGQAAPFKKQLVGMGAKASIPLAEPAPDNKPAPANK